MKSHIMKSCDPLVSVIVLSYNHSDTVARALDSVLALRAQCPDLEIVVGDDESSDGCYEICKEYAELYPDTICLMPREPNMGVVLNYFRCLKACRGEFVTDCAADDCRLPGTWLVQQINMLRNNPDIVAVGSDWVERRNGNDMKSSLNDAHSSWRTVVSGRDMMFGVLGAVGRFPVPLSAMLYRRCAIDVDSHMVCNPEFGCEDLPLVCALGAAGNFGFVSEESLLYFVNNESISNTAIQSRLLSFYHKVLVCRLTLVSHYHAYVPQVNYAISHGIKFVVGLAFDSGDKRWIQAVKATVFENRCRVPLSARFKLFIARYSLLWRIARTFKRYVKR